jgi:hypothetical protein
VGGSREVASQYFTFVATSGGTIAKCFGKLGAKWTPNLKTEALEFEAV